MTRASVDRLLPQPVEDFVSEVPEALAPPIAGGRLGRVADRRYNCHWHGTVRHGAVVRFRSVSGVSVTNSNPFHPGNRTARVVDRSAEPSPAPRLGTSKGTVERRAPCAEAASPWPLRTRTSPGTRLRLQSDLVRTESRNRMLKATETPCDVPAPATPPQDANRAQPPPTTHAPATSCLMSTCRHWSQ